MISHSPPIFSHSPPVSFLSELNYNSQNLPYNEDGKTKFFLPQMLKFQSRNANNNNNNVNSNITTNRCRGSRAAGLGLERMATAPELTTYPPKSCLIRRHNSKSKALDIQNENDNSRSRKKVIFADDQGLSLIEVRVMSEPSNVPPYWSMKFLEQITQGLVSPHPADTWTVDFKQPASDYLTFRQKIESNYVSLENVIVKDDESLILGTVKVKNISFNKEVIVRVTWDDWKSQQDIFCTFSRIYSPTTAAHVVFDTFAFKITLPPSSKKLEFCICFRANGVEYWDNNENKNYTVSKRSPFYYQSLAPYEKSHRSSNPITINNKYSLPSNDIKNHSEKQFITNNNNNSNHIMNNNYRNVSTSPYW